MSGEGFIETGVDKLVKLVENKKRISTHDAAKLLGVSSAVIDEWADFLEEEGIISLEYKLATTYMIERKLTKKEVVKKAKEFHGSKDAFINKIETTIQGIERDTSGLDELKDEFRNLKKEIGDDLGNVKDELKELENYERLKKNIDKQMYEQQNDFRNKIQEMEKVLFKEKSKYKELINDIEVEKVRLQEEKSDVLSLKEQEGKLLDQLDDFKDAIKEIRDSIKAEENKIDVSEDHIEYFQKVSDALEAKIRKHSENLDPLINESKKQEENILRTQQEVLKKVVDGRKKIDDNISESQKIAGKFKKFLSQKTQIDSMLTKVEKDKIDLSEELTNLIKKAHAFDLASKKSDVKKYMGELNKSFKEINSKRDNFKTELKKLVNLFKKSM